MSEVTGVGIFKVFLTKNVKEIFWDLNFLSENSGVGTHRFHCIVFFQSILMNFYAANLYLIVAQYLGIF
jgi:hypothetical protein